MSRTENAREPAPALSQLLEWQWRKGMTEPTVHKGLLLVFVSIKHKHNESNTLVNALGLITRKDTLYSIIR